MDKALEDLRAEAARLSVLFEETATALESTAVTLRAGIPPPADLGEVLRSVSGAYRELQEWTRRIPELTDETLALEDLGAVVTLLDEVAAKRLSAAVSSTREHALAVLKQVLAIRHKNIDDFPPLGKCHEAARSLRQEILGAPAATSLPAEHELESGVHPLAGFSRLVRELDSLDDDIVGTLDDQIREELGSALAIAAMRGLLVFRETEQLVPMVRPPAVQSPAHADGAAPATRTDALPQSGVNSVQPLELVSSVPADVPAPPTTQEPDASGHAASVPSPAVVAPPKGPAVAKESTSVVEDVAPTLSTSLRSGDLTAIDPLAWKLLSEKKADIALQLVSSYRDNTDAPSSGPRLLPWMLRPLLLGPLVGYPNGEVFRALRDDYSYFQEDWLATGDPGWRTSIGLVLAAGALRPALLAPGTGVSALLRSLHLGPGLERTYELTSRLAEHAERQHPLELSALLGAANQVEWQKRLTQLMTEIDEWLAQAPQRALIFAGATKVWRQWVSQGGILSSYVSQAKTLDAPFLSDAVKELDRYDDDATFRQLVNRTDRDQLGRKRGPDIAATALVQLRRGIKEAASFVRQAQQLASARPNDRDYLAQYARQIQTHLLGAHEHVISELRQLLIQGSHSLAGSALYMTAAVNDVVTLLRDVRPPQQEPDPNEVVQRILLCSTALTLDDDWQALEGPDAVRDAVLGLVDAPVPTFAEALPRQHTKGDHVATKRLLSAIGETETAADHLDELWAVREAGIDQQRSLVAQQVGNATSELEAAVAAGAIGEADRADLGSRIAAVKTAIDADFRFSVMVASLAEIRSQIQGHKGSASERLLAAMESEGVTQGHHAYVRIHQALTDGDILIANEYLDYVRRGEQLPEGPAAISAFDSFFPDTFRKISSALEAGPFRNLNKIVEALQEGQPLANLDFLAAPGELEDAALFMRSWANIDQSRGDTRESGIKQFMVQLGFPVKSATRLKLVSPRFVAFDVKTEIVADRFICPVPAFGSHAAGRYRVVCALERPTEEDLLAEVDRGGDGLATIVLYLGVLTEQRRRLLAKLSRQKPRSLVVLDSALALFLASRPGARLRSLFECSLPFTTVEPFTTTAGLVPPEMFFGRERERQSIIDPQGSCFIYGGRQLGKTALLRHVVRTFHEPERGQIALWIDLRPAGIGLDRPLDDVWNVLAQEFKRAGVIGLKTPDHAGPDRISKEIEAWIEADEHRRIVLMLDEADKFLESDGEGPHHFRHSALLKGLMDRTNRRFKVVFAGLHNVQRATQQANHPLAHFNDPLCIGPLIDQGEAQEARALIEVPFAALGYRFADAEPVTRILAQTNYYPSLIQLSCAQLLKHVSSQRGLPFDHKKMPPYEIDTKHVEDAYASQELWKQVKDRFQWTLQLDQRYEVIAYSIALESKADPKKLNEGFDARWIRDQALLFWDSGFSESRTEEAIRVLADEMVGLGLLRHSSDHRYALRNANVLSMMGTNAQIEDALERPREPPVEYQASAFRAVLRSAGHDKAWPRSPLTAQQTERLYSRSNDVTVVCGTVAGGIGLTRDFCRAATAEQAFYPVSSATADLRDLTEVLNEAFGRRMEGITIVHIGAEVPWTRNWLEHARDRLGRLTKTRDFVKIVFESGPDRLWDFCSGKADRNWLQQIRPNALTVTAWKEAALRQFLEDSNLTSDVGSRRRLTGLTGNWPGLLECLADSHVGTTTEGLRRIEACWATARWREQMLKDFGIETAPVIRRVLADFAMVGDATVRDLAGVVQDASPDEVEKVVLWAELLALVEARPGDKWAVDPILHRLLTSS